MNKDFIKDFDTGLVIFWDDKFVWIDDFVYLNSLFIDDLFIALK